MPPPTDAPPSELTWAWRWRAFDALTVHELHHLYQARQQVFVVDQGSIYVDADAYDPQAHHLAAWSPQQLLPLACARVLPPGLKYAEPAIGRVLTLPAVRGQGLGRALMHQALWHAAQLYAGQRVRLSAQSHLQGFYESLGFDAVGAPYLEDTIPHIEMLLREPL